MDIDAADKLIADSVREEVTTVEPPHWTTSAAKLSQTSPADTAIRTALDGCLEAQQDGLLCATC